jgi:carbon-monoxide dehydrogenase large subunit
MADRAYRAVFLRVHPTGKMELSLTTEPDGRERQYAEIAAAELGVPALDIKVVPADTNRFGVEHGYNTSPSEGTVAAITAVSGRIREQARLLAGAALGADPESLTWDNGAWVAGNGSDAERAQTIEDVALYAHGTGELPPGLEGHLDAQVVYRD